jgi:hypothetical protein
MSLVQRLTEKFEQESNEVPIVESKSDRPVLTNKTCTECLAKKPINAFRPINVNLRGQLKYTGKCRKCLAVYDAKRYIRKHPNASGKRGAKSQFDDVTVAKPIADMLSAGLSVRAVALALGYSYTTLYSAYRSGKFNIVNSDSDDN